MPYVKPSTPSIWVFVSKHIFFQSNTYALVRPILAVRWSVCVGIVCKQTLMSTGMPRHHWLSLRRII